MKCKRHTAGWKKKVVHELIEYWINFGYLAFFLVAFTWYRRLILAEYQVQYTNYWFPLIEAAVLAKVIMVGDLLRLGRATGKQAADPFRPFPDGDVQRMGGDF